MHTINSNKLLCKSLEEVFDKFEKHLKKKFEHYDKTKIENNKFYIRLNTFIEYDKLYFANNILKNSKKNNAKHYS